MQDDTDELRTRVEQPTALLGAVQESSGHECSPLIRSRARDPGGVDSGHSPCLGAHCPGAIEADAPSFIGERHDDGRQHRPRDDLEHLVEVRPRWRDRQPGIEATIRRFSLDIVALQEVWSSDETTQADELAKSLGMYAVFAAPSYPPAPTGTDLPDFEGVDLGIAVLSRWPILDQDPEGDAGTAPQLGSRVAHGPWLPPPGWSVADRRDVPGLRGVLHR